MSKKSITKRILVFLSFILILILSMYLVINTLNKKILFLKYGIIEGRNFYRVYKVDSINKISTIDKYDIYFVHTKYMGGVVNLWTPTLHFCSDEYVFRYGYDEVSVGNKKRSWINTYFIDGFKIYTAEEILNNGSIDIEEFIDIFSNQENIPFEYKINETKKCDNRGNEITKVGIAW